LQYWGLNSVSTSWATPAALLFWWVLSTQSSELFAGAGFQLSFYWSLPPE
jgi:hypothetical protein